MTYEYINPCEKGFIRVPVTRRQHNRLLPNCKQKFGAKVEYYWKQDGGIFEAQYFCSLWMKVVLIVFMFIPAVFMQGIPETIRDTGNLINERKRGKFSADRSWLKDDRDAELLEFINSKIGATNDQPNR
ncbi:hypothetical protein EGJ48_03600 [Pantoea dispersa]|uniref:hypothetical protein n=1 Tax=Pantoea dispersa TaxID=59814 RepID=UPI000F671048|nr:hypothetical protein [Pantoea dispersa]RRW77643.1 hypothetical protein EGJ48_03600 [Pantoea dispersa]